MLVAVLCAPIFDERPVQSQRGIRGHRRFQVRLKFRVLNQAFEAVSVNFVGAVFVGEIEPPRLAADARFQCALDGVTEEVVCAGELPSIQEGFCLPPTNSSQPTEVISVEVQACGPLVPRTDENGGAVLL